MAIVNLAQLSTEQMYGIKYGVQKANESLQFQINQANAENTRIAAENATKLPEFQQPLVPVPATFTDQSFADKILTDRVAELGQQLYDQKKRLVEERFNALTPEQQEAFLESLGVPSVLED